ncbi:MAG: 3-phosphoshikimate 1-carboxyvinyltransferase [Parvularculaceae bacterium]|nr:3-phosphoshikimate 1-carboxyvinyltransferase [Parvularculaceae bacterium]
MAASGGLSARRAGAIRGEARAPGDKSISHRALVLGALAGGESTVAGLLEGHDVLRTAAAMRALGAEVERDLTDNGPIWRISGAQWRSPERALYFGNSGTGCRLVLGAAAGAGVAARFDGDLSLRNRPMRRVAEPLIAMGAKVDAADGRLPIDLHPGALHGVEYALTVASAQVKSAILLAALGAKGKTTVIEPAPSRDHTERMLAAFGARLDIAAAGGGRRIAIEGGQQLKAASVEVPGDPSSAAFLAAAAAIAPGSDVLIRNVLVNPLRAGFYATLKEMGAAVEFVGARNLSGEPVADIRVRHAPLNGVVVPAQCAPSMIDEYPILSIVAAFASGTTRMEGLAELRVKESDRLAAIEDGLKANGVIAKSGLDWLEVQGRNGDVAGGGLVKTRLDHRIAMSFLVMGLASEKPVSIDDAAMIATSFPDFVATLRGLGGEIAPQ